jgi:nitric oxide reductase large subunit
MSVGSEISLRRIEDPVSNVLKWILLGVAIASFGLFAWATVLTYERAPPQPDRFVTSTGAPLMTGDDILGGKAGFQKADPMDYGSLYGMGSYSGPARERLENRRVLCCRRKARMSTTMLIARQSERVPSCEQSTQTQLPM